MTAELRKAVFQAQVAGLIDSKAAALVRAELEGQRQQEQAQNLEMLRQTLQSIIGLWRRPCFICDSLNWCKHREPELVKRWEKGYHS